MLSGDDPLCRVYIVPNNDEKELKFKQTDLRSDMVDLFVDLPMRLRSAR